MIFFFSLSLSQSPFQRHSLKAAHRSARAALVAGGSDVLGESEELTGLRCQCLRTLEALRSRLLQGLQALNREEVVFGTIDGY